MPRYLTNPEHDAKFPHIPRTNTYKDARGHDRIIHNRFLMDDAGTLHLITDRDLDIKTPQSVEKWFERALAEWRNS